MGQEFIIKSQGLEDKINQLLPSQGGFQAGVDLSASTTVIPIVDLTETAEGSALRQDLQTSLSLNTSTAYDVLNTTETLVSTTGYYRIFGVYRATGLNFTQIQLTDGTTTRSIQAFVASSGSNINVPYDFVVFIPAGQSCIAVSDSSNGRVAGVTRQIADISGNLQNP
mgnify:CR=1 FL=1|tara:strand:- start:52 stop:555 length:504 start_codon:yes stop_codon:yes gene_type:complete